MMNGQKNMFGIMKEKKELLDKQEMNKELKMGWLLGLQFREQKRNNTNQTKKQLLKLLKNQLACKINACTNYRTILNCIEKLLIKHEN